jgi:MFS family permease
MAYGALVFIVSLMMRVHGLTVGEAGGVFGGVFAAGAVVGNLVGGTWADRLAARDMAWLPRFSGWGMIVAIPFYELALWSSDIRLMGAMLFVGATILNGSVPAAFSSVHVVCGSKRRALAVALTFFFANLLGLGLGPLIAGALSDRFGAIYGSGEGLRIALVVVMWVLLPAGCLLIRAARHFRQDAED